MVSKKDHSECQITKEELKCLDNSSFEDKNPISTAEAGESDINSPRFKASLGVVLSCGTISLIANGVGFLCTIMKLAVVPLCWFLFEWYRIHGSLTLTRKLRAVLNVASVLATYQEFDPLYQKLYSADIFCSELPQLNTDLPRTADERSDQDKSPPKSKSVANRLSDITLSSK
ncbi:unnamed protein product [Bursaphelenchus xylophilus]|uniref:(pine wood nematode) hypothetical protein n=1 Tax=Bursaphelenchus xylophilus TaxID=6326 RepID=A0A1I7SD97_BURXY|nr:unnamed protein product [Bursaphelenchus xylophilus]CAG9130551.1 unnamed protein product [Bursaphelenchus xylophilus]